MTEKEQKARLLLIKFLLKQALEICDPIFAARSQQLQTPRSVWNCQTISTEIKGVLQHIQLTLALTDVKR